MRGKEQDDHGSVGSGLTPLVPSPSAAGLVAQPSGLADQALQSLFFFVLASGTFPLTAWLFGKSLDVPWPWGAALLPLTCVTAMVAICSTLCIFSAWKEDGSQSPVTSDGEGKSEGLMPTEPKPSPPSNHTEESKP